MSGEKLYEVVLPVDRWSLRAISPVDIREGLDPSSGSTAVIVHPGWAKSPERHADLLYGLLGAGFLPIGVDTRHGYSNQNSMQGLEQSADLYYRAITLVIQIHISIIKAGQPIDGS